MPTPRKDTHTKLHRSGRQVAGPYLQPLLEAAAEHGISADDLAQAVGLPKNGLTPLPESVAVEDYVHLLDAGAELCADSHFGLHVGERVKLGTYNVYGLILLSCSNFGQALQQTLRFESLAHDLGHSSINVNGALAEYRWDTNIPSASRHLVESVFAGIRVFGNWLAGTPLPPAPVTFTHAAPENCQEHLRIFGAPVTFSAPANCARFDAALLMRPIPNADISLYPVLQQHAERLLKEKLRAEADGGIVAQVRAMIGKNLAQDLVRLPLIAQGLNMPQRTLQRKLQEAGVTFQQVLDQTRHELAENYLKHNQFGIAEIAFLLGYQEQSSFNHAFKEWTGLNPSAYRDRINA